MRKTIVFSALLMAILSTTGYAADEQKINPPSGETKAPASSGAPSYFEGTWKGSWELFETTSSTQDFTLTIQRGKKEGVFVITYSTEFASIPGGNIPPATVKARGTLEGDKLNIKWTNKAGKEVQITLTKDRENEAKARIERPGPLRSGWRPTSDSVVHRK